VSKIKIEANKMTVLEEVRCSNPVKLSKNKPLASTSSPISSPSTRTNPVPDLRCPDRRWSARANTDVGIFRYRLFRSIFIDNPLTSIFAKDEAGVE